MAERKDRPTYDWAQATLGLATCESPRIEELVSAASLDPIAGDVAHLDLRGMDIAGADLRRWDITHALLSGANVTGADLRGAKFKPEQLALAKGWRNARLEAPAFRMTARASWELLMSRTIGEVLGVSSDRLNDEFTVDVEALRLPKGSVVKAIETSDFGDDSIDVRIYVENHKSKTLNKYMGRIEDGILYRGLPIDLLVRQFVNHSVHFDREHLNWVLTVASRVAEELPEDEPIPPVFASILPLLPISAYGGFPGINVRRLQAVLRRLDPLRLVVSAKKLKKKKKK